MFDYMFFQFLEDYGLLGVAGLITLALSIFLVKISTPLGEYIRSKTSLHTRKQKILNHNIFLILEKMIYQEVPSLQYGDKKSKVLGTIILVVRLTITLNNLKARLRNNITEQEVKDIITYNIGSINEETGKLGVPSIVLDNYYEAMSPSYEYYFAIVDHLIDMEYCNFRFIRILDNTLILLHAAPIAMRKVLANINGEVDNFNLADLNLDLIQSYPIPDWIVEEIKNARG